jgi:osmotically-inducible protein OsmY
MINRIRAASAAMAGLAGIALQGCSSMTTADAELNARVEASLEQNGSLAADGIHAQTHHGEVTLVGIVPTEIDRSNAVEIVSKVPGVEKVWNQIGAENR